MAESRETPLLPDIGKTSGKNIIPSSSSRRSTDVVVEPKDIRPGRSIVEHLKIKGNIAKEEERTKLDREKMIRKKSGEEMKAEEAANIIRKAAEVVVPVAAVVVVDKAKEWMDTNSSLANYVATESRTKVLSPAELDESHLEIKKRNALWNDYKSSEYHAGQKRELRSVIRGELEQYDNDSKLSKINSGVIVEDPLEKVLEYADNKIGRLIGTEFEDVVAQSWWNGAKRNMEIAGLRAEQKFRKDLNMNKSPELDTRIEDLERESKYLNWGKNSDMTRAAWRELASGHLEWLLTHDSEYVRAEAMARAQAMATRKQGAGIFGGAEGLDLFGFNLKTFERAEYERVKFPGLVAEVNISSMPEHWPESEKEWVAARVALLGITVSRLSVPTNPDKLEFVCTLAGLYKPDLNTLTNTHRVGEAMALIAYLAQTPKDLLPVEYADIDLFSVFRSGANKSLGEAKKKLGAILEEKYGDDLGIDYGESRVSRGTVVASVALSMLQAENFFERRFEDYQNYQYGDPIKKEPADPLSFPGDIANLAFYRLMHPGMRLRQFASEPTAQFNPPWELGRWIRTYRDKIIGISIVAGKEDANINAPSQVPFWQKEAMFDSYFNYAFGGDIDSKLTTLGEEIVKGNLPEVKLDWDGLKLPQPGIKYWADIVDSAKTIWSLTMTGQFPQGKGRNDIINAITLLAHGSKTTTLDDPTRVFIDKLAWNAANKGTGVDFKSVELRKDFSGTLMDNLERLFGNGKTGVESL